MQAEQSLDARLGRLALAEPVNDVWALIRAKTKPRESGIGSWIGGMNVWYRRAAATALAAGAIAAGVAMYHQPTSTPGGPALVQQPTKVESVHVQWSDDPLNHHNDTMMTYLVDM